MIARKKGSRARRRYPNTLDQLNHPRVPLHMCCCFKPASDCWIQRCFRCQLEDEKDRHATEKRRLLDEERKRMEPVAAKLAKAAGISPQQLGELLGFIFRALQEDIE